MVELVVERPPAGPARGLVPAPAGAVVALGVADLFGHLHPVSLFATMAVVSIGNGCSQPNAMAGAISVDQRYAGTASGITGFLQMGLGAVATVAISHVLGQSAIGLAAVMGIAFLLALIASALTRWPARPR